MYRNTDSNFNSLRDTTPTYAAIDLVTELVSCFYHLVYSNKLHHFANPKHRLPKVTKKRNSPIKRLKMK